MSDTDTNGVVHVKRALRLGTPPDTSAPTPGYGPEPTGEAHGPFRTEARGERPAPRPARPTAAASRPEVRTAARIGWKKALVAATAMRAAAEELDPMGLTIAADDLDLALGELWSLRAGRDLDWVTILNHMQGILRQAFAEKCVEEWTADQCRRVAEIVDRYLGPGTKTADDLTEVIRLIEDAGFDPYGAISGDPVGGEQEA